MAPRICTLFMSNRRCLQYDFAFAEEDLVAILARPPAIDDEELARPSERDQRMVPSAASIVHALPPIGDKGVQTTCRRRLARRGHDDQERLPAHGDKGLARERMALDHADCHRQRARESVEDIHPYLPLPLADIDGGEIAVTLGVAVIDGVVGIALGLDHLA